MLYHTKLKEVQKKDPLEELEVVLVKICQTMQHQ